MKIEFRVDWGYQFLYSRRQYHPIYCFDGHLEVANGQILFLSQLEYPYSWWGFVHSAREMPLTGNFWKSTVRRGMSGIAVTAQGSSSTEFRLVNAQGEYRFFAEQLLREGRVVFHVGWKESQCDIIVTRKNYLWYRPEPLSSEKVIEPKEFTQVKVVEWGRMLQAWIEPRHATEFVITLPNVSEVGEPYWLVHLQGMVAARPGYPEAFTRGRPKITLEKNGRTFFTFQHYFNYHDTDVQILEDVWAEIDYRKLKSGKHRLSLVNRDKKLHVLVNRLSFRLMVRRHLEIIACPKWALTGRPFCVRIRTLPERTGLIVDFDKKILKQLRSSAEVLTLGRGEHEIWFTGLRPALNAQIRFRDKHSGEENTATISALYNLPEEKPEVLVGYDMTTVNHDDSGEMDKILDYTSRTQLANFVLFRSFQPTPPSVPALRRWGDFCKRHAIFVESVYNCDAKVLARAAGKYFHGSGGHEHSLVLYGKDPDNRSESMKEAEKRYIKHIRPYVTNQRISGCRIGFGDASGGHRYSLLAGADYLRAETMVAHTTLLLSQARGTARAFGKKEWGVHIAIQHCKQPYLESHLGWYYLSLFQSWMMGANFLYEEDSQFLMLKEERQCWDDALTKGKREMTRWFLRYAKTHPRYSQPQVNIGVLQGRYAPPFNGFICGTEQDPSYSVWGEFGRKEPSWGHRQPEKGYQVMDVLMPGASTHPLRQRYDRRRFFFSGSPYGDFDQVPVESNLNNLNGYKLLLYLAWNTMIPADYRKLVRYVESGGTLFLSVPHFSRHEDRNFLETMEDLRLFNNGDILNLCGVKISGRGVMYSGRWQATGPDFKGARCPELSRAPSWNPNEDGPCHLAEIELQRARAVIIDPVSKKPLVVKHCFGRGCVYLMTTWAYPGHEELADLSGAVVSRLCEKNMVCPRVTDPTRETFWTYWPSGKRSGKLMLLNTDWTKTNECKPVNISTPAVSFKTKVREREMLAITCLPFGALIPMDPEPHVEIVSANAISARLHIHATGRHQFLLHAGTGSVSLKNDQGETVPGTRKKGAFCFELNWNQSSCQQIMLTIE